MINMRKTVKKCNQNLLQKNKNVFQLLGDDFKYVTTRPPSHPSLMFHFLKSS